MKFEDLQRAPTTGTIKLGRDRPAPARLLSPAEDAAVRRAVPEPEAPVVRTPEGEPMVDPQGRLVRDDGTPEYTARANAWMRRFCAVRVAVAIDYETRGGLAWTRASLNNPADGHVQLGAEGAFEKAEKKRRDYCIAAAEDILGGNEHDGLLTIDELEDAFDQCKKIGFTELVAESAEGNSGSAQRAG